jgi:mono/diheme cytochrome c family protein
MIRVRLVAALFVGSLFGAAYADEPNVYRGQAFAQQMCRGCHAIEKDETTSPNSMAPPFAKVSKSESLNAESFANWLGTAHPVINGVAVKPAVAGDILAYIRSLEPQKQQASVGR